MNNKYGSYVNTHRCSPRARPRLHERFLDGRTPEGTVRGEQGGNAEWKQMALPTRSVRQDRTVERAGVLQSVWV